MSNEQSTKMLTEYAPPNEISQASAFSLVMNNQKLTQLLQFAEIMAGGRVSVPKHLSGNQADCMAIVLQAMQWGMNPFAVASKTHLSPSGHLGYEAQLISAAVTTCGAVKAQFEFEFIGDWNKILGKVQEKTSDKGGKYYVANWDKKLEDGLGVKCRATLRGEQSPREITIMLSQCYPRFSTQWATDPQQQITYVAVRKFARRYAPAALLGVYSIDELDVIDITPTVVAEPKTTVEPPATTATPVYPDNLFQENLPKWLALIESGRKTSGAIIQMVSSKYTLTEVQRAMVEGQTVEPEPAPSSGSQEKQQGQSNDDWVTEYDSAGAAQ